MQEIVTVYKRQEGRITRPGAGITCRSRSLVLLVNELKTAVFISFHPFFDNACRFILAAIIHNNALPAGEVLVSNAFQGLHDVTRFPIVKWKNERDQRSGRLGRIVCLTRWSGEFKQAVHNGGDGSGRIEETCTEQRCAMQILFRIGILQTCEYLFSRSSFHASGNCCSMARNRLKAGWYRGSISSARSSISAAFVSSFCRTICALKVSSSALSFLPLSRRLTCSAAPIMAYDRASFSHQGNGTVSSFGATSRPGDME